MINAHTNLSLPGVVVTVLSSCLVAEFTGYWLHRLLHSDKVPVLSRGHLIHHFLVYGPRQSMRSTGYKDATEGRFSVGNIGLEWLVPSAIVLSFCWGSMALFAVPRAYQIVSFCTLLIWPIFMFNYLHDRMHLKNFWMSRVPLLRIWYINARKLHDIHHLQLNNEGRMDANFGIGFFFFDRLFRTIAKGHRTFNWAGYRVAKERYCLLVDPVGHDAPRLQEDSPWKVGGRAKEETIRAAHETMSWRKALLLALFLLSAIPDAYAQRIEVTPFFGSRFGGTIDLTQQSNPNADFMKIKSGTNYGILTDISFLRHFQGEFMWSRQPTSLKVHNPNDGTYTFLSKMNLDVYQFGVAYEFRKPEAKVRPFIVLGLGFSHYGVPTINAKQPVAGSLGGGVKYYFTRNFGIRVEGRLLTTDTTYKGMEICSYPYSFGESCPVNNSAHQGQVNIGLIFRFK